MNRLTWYPIPIYHQGPSCSWSYGSWIYNYRCCECLSPLMLWVRISTRARCTTLCDKVCQWLATGRWFSPGPPVSSTNKTDRHDMTEILLKVVINTIKQTIKQTYILIYIEVGHTAFVYNKTDPHDITEILLKVALNNINIKLWFQVILYTLRRKHSVATGISLNYIKYC